jgi:hypothetical protein
MCAYRHPDGRQCQTPPLRGEQFCFFHHPNYEEARKHAQRSGGLKGSRAVLPSAVYHRLDTRDALIDLLSETVQQVRTGQLDCKVANAVGYLANVIRQVIEESDLETLRAEIEALKERLGVAA